MPDRLWRWLFILAFRPRQWLRARLGLAHGGAFVAVRSDRDLLVVRHSYRVGVDFPGGGLARGELPAAGAARELREELALSFDDAALRYLGVVRRGFRVGEEPDHVFELRLPVLPVPQVDNREIIWAGSLATAETTWRELQLPVRWYLRRHGRGLPQVPAP